MLVMRSSRDLAPLSITLRVLDITRRRFSQEFDKVTVELVVESAIVHTRG
jgi:hypothetical protein